MSEFRCGQFVKYVLPNRKKECVALLVAQDDYVAKRRLPPKLVSPAGGCLPLDTLKMSGGKVVEVLPINHPEAGMALARFLAPDGFVYEHQPVVRTFFHDGCLVAYLKVADTKVKVLPLNPVVTDETRNRIHAIHAFRRIVALPKEYRAARASGFGKGDLVQHHALGKGAHLGSIVLFEKPHRLWPKSTMDLRYADWATAGQVDAPGVLRFAPHDHLEFNRCPTVFPEPETGNGPNNFDLPHDWECRNSHCAKCGSDGLLSRNLEGLGIARFCQDCTWTGLVPTVRTTLRTILAAEQEFRLSFLSDRRHLSA